MARKFQNKRSKTGQKRNGSGLPGLLAIRRDRGWTQLQMAQFLGVSLPYVSMLENRKVSPRIDTAEAIAAKLGVTVAQLLADPQEAA